MKNITDITEPVAQTKIIPNEYYALEGQTVCIIRMFDVALALSLKNRVLYITDDEKQYDRFIKFVVYNKEFGNDDNVLLVKNSNKNYLNQKLYDNMEKFLNMNRKKKFDLSIMNPPWGRDGWKIAYEAWKRTAGKVVCLNSNNILHTLSRFEEKSYFQDFKDMFGCLEDEQRFSPQEILKLFPKKDETHDVQSTTHVSLTTFGHSYKEPTKTEFEQMLVEHIAKYPAEYKTNFLNDYAVYIPMVNSDAKNNSVLRNTMIVCERKNGSMICCYKRNLIAPKQKQKEIIGKVWWDCYQKNKWTKQQNEMSAGIAFKTFEEAKNYVDSQDTKFMRYANNILLSDMNIAQKNILFMENYSKPWTDKRFCEYFGITGYIDDDHAEPNSEWEIILNTMKKYE